MSMHDKYYRLTSINCWIDINNLYVCSTNKETGDPDLHNYKQLSELDPSWYLHLSSDEKEFLAELLNKNKQ
jgi:hypothetical protein